MTSMGMSMDSRPMRRVREDLIHGEGQSDYQGIGIQLRVGKVIVILEMSGHHHGLIGRHWCGPLGMDVNMFFFVLLKGICQQQDPAQAVGIDVDLGGIGDDAVELLHVVKQLSCDLKLAAGGQPLSVQRQKRQDLRVEMKASGSAVGDLHIGADGLGGSFHGIRGLTLIVSPKAGPGILVRIQAVAKHGDQKADRQKTD